MKKLELSVEIDGVEYIGFRKISSNKLGNFQVIYLDNNIKERDQGSYVKAETDPTAIFVAKNILTSLVRRHLL